MGTRDGATIEIAREVGEENAFLFGLSADQVAASRSWYNPQWHYDNEPATRSAVDLLFSEHINQREPGLFEPVRRALLSQGDYYMHLADLASYVQAQERLGTLYAGDPSAWTSKAIVNVAAAGRFSSDRTISEYAKDIWAARPCPVT
jgi:starch phosphorylase